MWLTGFDQLMPEGRASPYKYLPRPGARLSVTFGDPLPSEDIKKALGELSVERPTVPFSSELRKTKGRMVGEATRELNRNDAQNLRGAENLKIRTEVTALVQRAVESLGRSISGNSLSQPI
jgi:monolysocardiolipin acyltransferase